MAKKLLASPEAAPSRHRVVGDTSRLEDLIPKERALTSNPAVGGSSSICPHLRFLEEPDAEAEVQG